jgi:hypothetical protein
MIVSFIEMGYLLYRRHIDDGFTFIVGQARTAEVRTYPIYFYHPTMGQITTNLGLATVERCPRDFSEDRNAPDNRLVPSSLALVTAQSKEKLKVKP